MTMTASIHGRAAFDARERTTKTGNPMTTLRLAVDVTGNNGDDETLWIDVLAFGRDAETMARVTKGESISAMGRVTRGQYTNKDGETRESWTMLADSVLTVRSARPGQRRQAAQRRQDTQAPDFDDPLGF